MSNGNVDHETGKDPYALFGTDAADGAVAEQIDWSSFVNLEYDPTIPIAPNAGQLATSASYPNLSDSVPNINDTTTVPEDVSSFAALDFPSMDEWWAELPNEVQSGEWVSLTGEPQGCTPHSDSNSSAYVDLQSPEDEDEGGARKRRRRMPPEAKRLLTECFERHKEDPYISKEEMHKLVMETGLSLRQVQTFFANARARKLPVASTESKCVDISIPENQQCPMERFLSSSPEDEGISEEAVRAAANKMKRPIKPLRSKKSGPPSVRSSSQSSTSNSSSASMDSLDSRGSRKGRKRQRERSQIGSTAKSIFRKPSSPSRKYQCTFCTVDFEQKYDWKRHEESVHFPQKEWVCMPSGYIEGDRCVFCEQENADNKHLNTHKSIACFEAPRAQRTFQRKDKLVQHIKQVHGCQPPKMIKEWCRPIERSVLLLCGFCSLELPDWKTRSDHISSHFSDGIDMTLWLPELIGAIWPNDVLTKNYVRDRFSATEHPDGTTTCPTCPARFQNLRTLTLHRRQVHNIFLPTDSRVILAKPVGQHPQRLINLAQQTSRIQIARVDDHEAPQTVPPQGPLTAHPDYTTVFSAGGVRLGMKPPINRQLVQPEQRGFSSAPHSVWTNVLNQGAIAMPRGVSGRNPLNQRPTMTMPRGPATRGSSLRHNNIAGTGLSHTETAAGVARDLGPGRQGPPVEAIRAILTSSRDGVENVDVPAQGMLHSLEQFGKADKPWPRPPV